MRVAVESGGRVHLDHHLACESFNVVQYQHLARVVEIQPAIRSGGHDGRVHAVEGRVLLL